MPALDILVATLPRVVVLPTPLTPTKSHTSTVREGSPSAGSGRSAPTTDRPAASDVSMATRSALSASTRSSGPPISPEVTRPRRSSSRASVAPTPDVGPDQRLLEVVPGGRVDLSPGPDGPDVTGQQAPGLAQSPPVGRGLRLRLGCRFRLDGGRDLDRCHRSDRRGAAVGAGRSATATPPPDSVDVSGAWSSLPRRRVARATPPATRTTGTAMTTAMTASEAAVTTAASITGRRVGSRRARHDRWPRRRRRPGAEARR